MPLSQREERIRERLALGPLDPVSFCSTQGQLDRAQADGAELIVLVDSGEFVLNDAEGSYGRVLCFGAQVRSQAVSLEAYDDSKIILRGQATVTAHDTARVRASHGATALCRDESRLTMLGKDCRAELKDRSGVDALGGYVHLHDRATVWTAQSGTVIVVASDHCGRLHNLRATSRVFGPPGVERRIVNSSDNCRVTHGEEQRWLSGKVDLRKVAGERLGKLLEWQR